MNREAIVERIWNTPALLGIPRKHLEKSLEGAGFFDLLAAAIELLHEELHVFPRSLTGVNESRIPSKVVDAFSAVVAKITGDTP